MISLIVEYKSKTKQTKQKQLHRNRDQRNEFQKEGVGR